ncbi:hypothetical protein [Microbispora sp. NPDC046933]|uniref:hypothetical protein n=1 Tax=Microbispora sp. NPDC046933 TaxID=3155618 RepID=UPI0033D5E6BB
MTILDVDQFVAGGFAKVEAGVPHEVRDAARGLLWQRIGGSPGDRSGTQPVVWAPDLTPTRPKPPAPGEDTPLGRATGW